MRRSWRAGLAAMLAAAVSAPAGGQPTPGAQLADPEANIVEELVVVARDRGASRAVLFTNNPSAVRTYTAIGFQCIGDYSLLLLR